MQAGRITVADGMRRHLVTLEREQRSLEQSMELCRCLKNREERLAELDAGSLLAEMEQMEQAGSTFQDKQYGDVKPIRYAAAVIAALVMTAFMAGVIALMIWGFTVEAAEAPPLPLIVVLVALPASAALHGLLAVCTLAPYFLLYDYSGIWDASVSSQFNYFSDMLVVRPFLTWGDFTVGQYLAAALALGAVLTTAFSLLASVCGTLVRNPYLAALALGVVCFGGMGLISVLGELGWWAAYLIACFQPVMIWLSCSAWFTELGLSALLPWQETIANGLNLLLLGGGVLLALGWFDRKDVS